MKSYLERKRIRPDSISKRIVMKNETDSDFDNNQHDREPWNYVLASFLFFNFVVTEWANVSLLYSINKKKLNSVRAQVVKCMIICGALNSGFLSAPAGVAALGETRVISRTGCVYHNLIMQTSSVANRLLMLLLAVEQFCILMGKRRFRMSKSALSPMLFVIFLISVFVSSLTILHEDKYVTRRNVFLCVLPTDWLTITFEASSYIIPCVFIICITTYSAYVTNDGTTHLTNENTNNDISSSSEVRPTQLSPNVHKSVISISRIMIFLSFLFICSSFLRLIGVVLNYDPLFLVIVLICDTIAYTVQPLAFIYSSSALKNNFEELMIISFSRTTTSVQVPSPSHESNIITLPITSVSGGLATTIDTAKGNEGSHKKIKTDEDTNIVNDNKSIQVSRATETEKSWTKFTIPKETERQKRYEFSLGACGGDSSLVQFESTVDLYKYVSTCNPTSVNVEINNIDDDLPKENFTDDSPENVHRRSFNERLRITYPYKHIDCSTSQRYSHTSLTKNRSHSLEMLQEDKQLMHMHGSVMRDSEKILPTVQVDSIGMASSKQYRISTTCPGLLRDPDNKPQRRTTPTWLESNDHSMRKESDTGELVVRKY